MLISGLKRVNINLYLYHLSFKPISIYLGCYFLSLLELLLLFIQNSLLCQSKVLNFIF